MLLRPGIYMNSTTKVFSIKLFFGLKQIYFIGFHASVILTALLAYEMSSKIWAKIKEIIKK